MHDCLSPVHSVSNAVSCVKIVELIELLTFRRQLHSVLYTLYCVIKNVKFLHRVWVFSVLEPNSGLLFLDCFITLQTTASYEMRLSQIVDDTQLSNFL